MTLDFTPLKKMRSFWGSASMWAYILCAMRAIDTDKRGNQRLAAQWMAAAWEWVPAFPARLFTS
jgi:hypothetical protein